MNRNYKFKKISLVLMIILSILISSANAFADSAYTGKKMAYETLFAKDDVIDIYVDIKAEDWQSILDNPLLEEYHSANITVDGIKLENVGFRTKGNSSLTSVANSDSDRYSFRIKTKKYVKGQKLLDLDEFVVNNMMSDPSYMREYLTYEAMAQVGLNTCKTVYANLYINGELYGFYLCVEAIDESYLKRNFSNADGNLYKADIGSTLEYISDSNYDTLELKVGNDTEKTGLKNLIKVLNDMPLGEKGDIEKVLDVNSALMNIAANVVFGNFDSYNGSMAQNYYLYENNGVFVMLPWDLNMSIGGFGGGAQTQVDINNPVSGVNINDRPLISKLLAVPSYKEKYYEYVKEFAQYLNTIEARVNELASTIRDYVYNDPSKFYTNEEFEASITYSEYDPSKGDQGGVFTLRTDDMRNDVGRAFGAPSENQAPPNGMITNIAAGNTKIDPNQKNGNVMVFFNGQDGQQNMNFDTNMFQNGPVPDGFIPPEGNDVFFDGKGKSMLGHIPISIITYAIERLTFIKSQFAD